MSSLRNAVKRRVHKERAQPAQRRRLGLLEKHKDYKLRAKDYHRKQDTLQSLRQKAELRNPDEFYHGMVKARTVNGQQRLDKYPRYSAEEMKRFTVQDLAYVSSYKQKEAKKIDRMSSSLHVLGATGTSDRQREHLVFVDDKKEVETFDPVEYLDTLPELLERRHNRPRKSKLSEARVVAPVSGYSKKDQNTLKKIEKSRQRSYKELAGHVEREHKLEKMAADLQTRRNLMGKGRRRKVKDGDGDQPAIYKWKRERRK